MKNKFDINDKVIISKKGIFEGAKGQIISMSATIDFGALGQWSFNLNDLVLSNDPNKPNEMQIKPLEAIISENDTMDKPNAVKAPKVVKKAKVKKVVNDKPKRAYVKKDKAI